MKTLFLSIIIASIVVATIISISFFFNSGNNISPCTFCPAQRAPNQPLQVQDVTTEPSPPIVGSTFLIYANVYNPNPYSVYIRAGCISPLSATFDKGVEVTVNTSILCPRMLKQEIPSGQEARILGPSLGIMYNATSVGITNATITVSYEAQGKTENVTLSKQFTIDDRGFYP
jgi:hypothetical protein